MKRSILLAGCVLALTLSGSFGYAQMDGGMMGDGRGGMMTPEKPLKSAAADVGAKIFTDHCASCHPDGGNIIVPDLPLKGSRVLANFRTFIAFIRNPRMPDGSKGGMPPFGRSELSDRQARALYHYVMTAAGYGAGGAYGMGRGMMGGGGYGMRRGMMGGYGMGPGMMGGYGIGRGMMNYQTYSPECQKFYDETAELRKELHNKRFEYFEALRNPKTTGEAVMKLDKEMEDLQQKIYSRAPLGCGW